MSAELLHDWYVSATSSDLGITTGGASDKQKHNADKVYQVFHALGWTDNAIAGLVANMQSESWLNPADVTPKSGFPNGGATLEDLSNQYALNIKTPAYGLVQWKGLGSTEPIANQLVSYAYRHGSEWYEGQIQMDRLTWEYQSNSKWLDRETQTSAHHTMTFSEYAHSTESADMLAYYWMLHYERTYSLVPERKANGIYWYNYFTSGPGPEPPTPPLEDGWITGTDFAMMALEYDGVYIPYDQMDCVHFVNDVWKKINDYTRTTNITMGTNRLWRSTRTFDTASPLGADPCPELYYKGTIDECIESFGEIPQGALLFHKISEEGPPQIPDEYRGDGIGNFAHVGIYCGNNTVMQSGGRDSASVPGGGVHKSTYDPQAWNYVAFLVYVDCIDNLPPEPVFKWWLLYLFKKGRRIKNVRRDYSRNL